MRKLQSFEESSTIEKTKELAKLLGIMTGKHELMILELLIKKQPTRIPYCPESSRASARLFDAGLVSFKREGSAAKIWSLTEKFDSIIKKIEDVV